MKDWGQTMLKMYDTKRLVDYTTQWLGFSTDNGAYYYYNWDQHYLPGVTNYQQVHVYSQVSAYLPWNCVKSSSY